MAYARASARPGRVMNAPAPAAAAETSRLRAALLAGLIVVLGCGVYAPAFHGGWLWDDNVDITENVLLRDVSGLFKIWFQPMLFDYYPLKSTVQWFQWQLWGDRPTGYHITNVVLHLCSALLFWRVLARLGLRRLAWVGGLWFAVHPLAVASVAWIAELKNALSLPPLLLALLAWLDFEDRAARRDYFKALGWFLVALLCKTAVVMLPVTLMLLAWWRHGRIGFADLRRTAPFFALSLFFGLLTVWFQFTRSQAGETLAVVSGLGERLALAGTTLAFYASKVLWPAPLMPIYERWPLSPLVFWHFLPWLGLATAAFCAWRVRGNFTARTLLLGLGWFVAHLLPSSGLVTISFMRFSWVMDHLAYVSLLGGIGLGVAGLDWISRRFNRGDVVAIGVALGLAGVLALLAFRQASTYRSPLAFWENAVRGNPAAAVAHANLGLARSQAGDLPGALAAYTRALELQPDYFEPRLNSGNVLRQQGHLDAAIPHLEAAVRLKPAVATGHYNLALALIDAGRLEAALPPLDRTLALKPEHTDALDARGEVFRRLGRAEEARRDFVAALQLRPDFAAAHHHLGLLLVAAGHADAGLPHLEAAVRHDPAYAEAHSNLATVLAGRQREPEAIAHLERAVALRPDFADARLNLGILLVRAGRAADAVRHLETLRQSGPASLRVLYNLALAHAAAGDFPAANLRYAEARALDPALPARTFAP